MRPRLARVAALSVAALMLAAPAVARAWTDARVRTVSAHVRIAPDAAADVRLVAQLRVDGGWLEAFEIDGLDPDLSLLSEPPASFVEATGRVLAPDVEHAGEGRVVFAFRRRASPRRGDYVATLAYRTSLAHRATEVDEEGRVVVRWTLPSWRYGLDDVEVTIDAPAGARAVRDERDDGTVEIARTEDAGIVRLVLRRAHLPRTREWPIAITVPADAMDASLRAPAGARRPAPPSTPARGEAPALPGAALIAAALAALAVAKNAAVARAHRRSRVAPSPLLPLRAWVRSLLAVALAAAAALLGDRPELALPALGAIALLAVHRRSDAPRPPRLGSFRPTTAADHVRARRELRGERVGLGAWLDATTVPGATVLAAIAAAPAIAWAEDALPVSLPHALLASALAGAMILGGSRRARPPSPRVDLAHLLAHAARARAPLAHDADADAARAWSLRPVLHTDVRGEAQDARLRVALASTPKGLLRLDLVRTARAERGCWCSELQLLAVTREGSPADRALEERFAAARIAGAPRRVARLFPIASDLATTLAPLLDAVAQCPREEAARDAARHTDGALAASA